VIDLEQRHDLRNERDEPALGEHHLAVIHVPHVNMACRVRRKQQTCDDEFLVVLLLQQSKNTLHFAVLYWPPSLMLDDHV
jgi:hypothetical protein